MQLKELLNPGFTEEEGVFYFTDVRADIDPSRTTDATNESKWSYWRQENFSFFKRSLPPQAAEEVILDIGVGQAHFHELLTGRTVYGVDFYPYPKAHVVCDFGSGLPFRDAAADIILLSNVLEHLRDPALLLRECHRVLKPGGVLIGAVPFFINVHQRPYDFFRYTDIALASLLSEAGYRKSDVEPVLSLYALFHTVTTRLFINAIRYTSYGSHYVDVSIRLLLRIGWLIFRVLFFGVLKSLLRRVKGDKNYPLGYHFKGFRQ